MRLSSLLLLSSSLAVLPLALSSCREPVGETKNNYDSCWDQGYVDYLGCAADCQRACTFTEGCNSWAYHHDRGNKRCHLCSWDTPRVENSCDEEDNLCSTWGEREEGVSPTTVLNGALDLAEGVCTGELQGSDALQVASDLNVFVKNHGIEDSFQSDEEFMANLPSAIKRMAAILKGETNECFDAYTSPDHTCKYGSFVMHQLRALLMYNDRNAKRAWPMKRDMLRRTLFNKYKIFMGDNGWLNKDSIKTITAFYSQLDKHLKVDGILYNAPLFALQQVKGAWKCDGEPELNLNVSRRAFNVFKLQVGDRKEQGFPSDTPDRVDSADLQMVVTRHEVTHQFDRIMKNRRDDGDTRIFDMFKQLIEASEGSDSNWLRSQVGDEYFQGANQEIIASQIGNQYFQSSTTQMRLAAHRLNQDEGWTPPVYQNVEEGKATLTRDEYSCVSVKKIGVFDSADECAAVAMDHPDCTSSYEIMYSENYKSWGCKCCKAATEMNCPTDEMLYNSHNLWDVYQYKNVEEDLTCSTTGVPMGWFLFNVDLMTPVGSDTVKFYEHEVNGYVRTFDVSITRDDNDRIISLDIPSCGQVSVTYGNDGLVNTVSSNAVSCSIPCENDSAWQLKSDNRKGCSWVAKKPSKRCKKKGKDKRRAFDGCPEACGRCPA